MNKPNSLPTALIFHLINLHIHAITSGFTIPIITAVHHFTVATVPKIQSIVPVCPRTAQRILKALVDHSLLTCKSISLGSKGRLHNLYSIHPAIKQQFFQ